MHEPPVLHPETYDDGDASEQSGEMLETDLGAIPRRDVVTVSPGESVSAVVHKLIDARTGCALVVEDGKLVGIFTERDVLQRVTGRAMDTNAIIVREVMTGDPDTLPADTTVAYALNRMSVEGYRHIPLVDASGAPVGVVGMRDIITWMVELFPERVLNVPPVPSSYPKTREGG